MITAAEMLQKLQRAQEFGLKLEGKVLPDMQRLMARKEKVIQDQAKGLRDLFQHTDSVCAGAGCDGTAGVVVATGADGKTLEIPWDRLIVAPGTRL